MAIEETLRIIDQGTPALKSVAAEAKRAEVALDLVEGGASNLGRGFAQLRGSASLLSPELGEVAGIANDLFDALEVGSQAAKASGISLASLGAVAGPVGIAVTALGAAYLYLNEQLTEAEGKAAAAAATASAMQASVDLWRGSVDALNTEFAIANGLLDEDQAATNAKIERLKEQRAATEALLRAEYDRAAAATEAEGATKADSAAAAQARERLQAYQQATEDLATKVELLGDKHRLDEEATKAAAAAAKAAAEEKKREGEAERELAAHYAADEREIRENLRRRAEEREQTEAVMLMAAEAEMAALEDQRRATEELAEAEKKLAEERKANSDSAIRATGEGVTGGPEAGVNALSNAGPWGELIAGLVELVTNLGDSLAGFQDYHEGLMNAIGSLPSTLADNMGSIFSDSFATIIPDFIDSFTASFPELIGGLVGGIVGTTANLLISLVIELPIALIKGFLSIFTADFWTGIGDAIVSAFNEAFGGGPDDPLAGTSTSGKVSGRGGSGRDAGADRAYDAAHAKRGGYDTGSSFVPQTGLYQLERGEEVLRTGSRGTSRQEARMGRTVGARVGYGAGGMQITAVIQVDDESFERGVQSARARGYGV
jgi:chemotaxis protein histidine kinase CheA